MITPNVNIGPARVGGIYSGPVTTIEELCTQAGIPYKYFGGDLPFAGCSSGSGNLRAVDERNHRVLVVDEEQFTSDTPAERSLRILEILAHSFHEYAARECVRGLFGYSTSAESTERRDTSSMTAAERKARQRSRATETGMCYVCLTSPAREHRSTCASCAAYHAHAQRVRRAKRRRTAQT
jgi:hypothetical protein